MSILVLLLSFSLILGTTHAVVPIDCPKDTDPNLCIKVGFTTSQTGAQAYEGQLHGNGTIMWADDVNKNGGLKTVAKGNDKSVFIKLIYYDDASNAATCTQLYKNLINDDKVDVLLGPYGTSLTQAARNVAHNNSKLLIAGSAAADSTYSINYPLFFGIVTTGSKYMAPLLTSLYTKSARTAVILRSDADFASSVAEGAIASLGTLGYQILGVREFKRSDASAATLAPIVAALASYNADVFIAAILLENGEEVLAGILATKYRPKALIMQSAGASTAFIADQGDRANHILAPSQWEITTQFTGSFYTDTKDYERKFSTRFNTSTFPSYISAEATAAGIILGHALSNATNHTATELAAWLDGLQVPIPTFFGPVKFDETGRNIQKQMVGTQIQNGKIVQVTGAGAQAELVYPMKWLVPANDASRLSISIPYIVIASLLFALWM